MKLRIGKKDVNVQELVYTFGTLETYNNKSYNIESNLRIQYL